MFNKIKNDFTIIRNYLKNNINFEPTSHKLLLILLIITAICVMIHLRYKNELLTLTIKSQNEHFSNKEPELDTPFKYLSPNQLKLHFAKTSDAQQLFAQSKYLDTMNKINVEAREIPTKKQCYINYQNAFDTITKEEEELTKKAVRLLINTLIEQDNKEYAYYLKHWLEASIIAKQHSWLESNMPHTHNNYIVLNQHWFDSPYNNRQTLIHEMTHVHQRYKHSFYQSLFEQWGFTYYPYKVETIKGLEQAVMLTRHNPDGLNLNWILTLDGNHYWITSKYPDINEPKLTRADYLAYPLTKDNQGRYYYTGTTPTPLKDFNAFMEFFGIHNNHYHPNEISAQYAEYYLDDCMVKRNSKELTKYKYPAYLIYLDWANANLIS